MASESNNALNNSIDSDVNKTKKDVITPQRCAGDFVKQYLKSSSRVKFANDIMNSGDIVDPSTLALLSAFISNSSKYSGIDSSKITIAMLRREISGFYVGLENKRQNFRAICINEYDIPISEFDSKILRDLKGFDESKIKELIDSQKKRDEYLKSKLGKSLQKKQTIYTLDKITYEKGQKRFKKLPREDQIEVGSILDSYRNGNKISDVDLKILFDSGIFTQNEKKELVHTFIPTISLQRAIDINLIDENKANTIKKSVLGKQMSNSGFSSSQIEALLQNTSFDDIDVSTSDFFPDKKSIEKLANGVGFKNMSNDFNSVLDDAKAEADGQGPQNLSEFKKELSKNPSFKSSEKLSEGSFIKVTKSDTKGAKKESYMKVIKTDIGGKNKISLVGAGDGEKINIGDDLEIISYNKLLQSFNQTGLSIEVFTDSEIQQKVSAGELKKTINFYKAYNEDQLNLEVDDLNQALVDKRKELEARKTDLENELDSLEENYKKTKSPAIKSRIDSINTELSQLENIENHPEYKAIYDQILNKKNSLKNIGATNLAKLIEDINGLDPEGKSLGLSKGTVLYTKDGDYFTIDGIVESEGKLTVINQGRRETGTFQEVFDVFKSREIKRKKPLGSIKEFLDEAKKEGYDDWKGYENDNGKIVYKENPTSTGIPLEYFTSKEGKYVKVVGNNSDGFEIEEGTFEETFEKDRKGKFKEDKKGDKISLTEMTLNRRKRRVTYSELQGLLKKNKLKPHYSFLKNPKDLQEKITPNPKNALSGSFLSRFLSNLSFSELLMGGKLVVDGFTEFLKKSNDIHAAKAALAMGSFIPLGEFQRELEIKVESSESEAMQKEIDGLGKVDSNIAAKRIREWLKNKDTPEHKKEAGLMFMLEKYGMLYAKELYEEKGTFLFYTSFGGTVGDALFMKKKEEAKKEGVTFTEEYLMHSLLKAQCKGDLPPKRRSRLHKEFEGKWKSGITAEIDKGYNDASNKRLAKSAMEGGMGELDGGTIANAIGWFKKSIEIGGSMEDMTVGFFCLFYSGAMYGLPQDVFKKIKALWDGDGMPILITRFASTIEEMKLFNETVLKVSKRIHDEYGDEFPDIYSRAKKIYEGAEKGGGGELGRIKESRKFFKDYSEPLLNSLNMRLTSDSKYSKTDKIIDTKLERENEPVFEKYYQKVRGYSDQCAYKPEFMNDAVKDWGVTGHKPINLVKKYLRFDTGEGPKDSDNFENVWGELSRDLKATPDRIWSGYSKKDELGNRLEQKKYIVGKLKEIIAGCLSNHGSKAGLFYNGNNSIGYDFNNWKLDIIRDFGTLNERSIMEDGAGQEQFERVADNIISGGKTSSSPVDTVPAKVSEILGL